VGATPTGLVRIFGVGPISTARILGEVGDVARFRSRHHFASDNGTGPDDAGSGGVPVQRVNLKGNRKINHAIHMVAITQIRNDTPGRAYYLRKQAQGKTQKETLRALTRRISDAIYRQLVEDAGLDMGPGGQTGTTLESSVTSPTPTAGSSDKPQPGPAPKLRRSPQPLDRGVPICTSGPASPRAVLVLVHIQAASRERKLAGGAANYRPLPTISPRPR
jgi:transposase